MANNFSADSNCVAVFRVESGALTTDSKGTNTLTDNGTVQSDTTNFKEGAGSAYFSDTNNEYLSCTDANLDAGFPLKSDAGTTISVTFWVRPTANNKTIWSKVTTGAGGGGIYCYLSTAKITFWLYDNLGAIQGVSHATTSFTLNQFYHVGFTYLSTDQTYRLRIWDDTASALLHADVTGTSSKILNVCNAQLQIGKGGGGTELEGNIDEFCVFDDILGADEIDQIRGGTYGAGGSTPKPKPIMLVQTSDYNRHVKMEA